MCQYEYWNVKLLNFAVLNDMSCTIICTFYIKLSHHLVNVHHTLKAFTDTLLLYDVKSKDKDCIGSFFLSVSLKCLIIIYGI